MQEFLLNNTAYFVACNKEHPYSRREVFERLGEKKFVLGILEKGIATPQTLLKFRPMLRHQRDKVLHSVIKFLVKTGKWEDASNLAQDEDKQSLMYHRGQYWSKKFLEKKGDGWLCQESMEAGELWHIPAEKLNFSSGNKRVLLKKGVIPPEKEWPFLWEKHPELEKYLVKNRLISNPPKGCRAKAYNTAKKHGNAAYALHIEQEFEKEISGSPYTEEEKFLAFYWYCISFSTHTSIPMSPGYSARCVDKFCLLLEKGNISCQLVVKILKEGKVMRAVMNSPGRDRFRQEVQREVSEKGPRFFLSLYGDAIESLLFYNLCDKKLALENTNVGTVQTYIDRGILTKQDMENFWSFE